ncbi:MAG: DegT/DnrJ/EryC1/StrS family aminotransferase [Deltaproteobacteria bacterium]|nr:DegT/DnrJ/EryC1/StrS family aminotransferase [Deltaproteobacteria bacterium]
MNIPITKIDTTSEDERAVCEVLRSGWLTQGPKVSEFETLFAAYVGAPYAIATSSCTTALHLALQVAGVNSDHEVIVPSYSFIATANCVAHRGARTIFADIDLDTYNLDPKDVERKITPKTKAIIVVHQLGMPADLNAFLELTKKYELTLIEDAACAIGAIYRHKKIGSFSDLTCFSLHARKIITTGEGGMITSFNPKFVEQLKCIRSHGMSLSDAERHRSQKILLEEYHALGFNYRLSDLQAALGISQLHRIEDIISKRIYLAKRYDDAFKNVAEITTPPVPSFVRHTYQSYNIRLNQREPSFRDKLMQALASKKIMTRRIMAIHQTPLYAKTCDKLPNTEMAVKNCLLLPIYPQMTLDEQDYVIDTLLSCL